MTPHPTTICEHCRRADPDLVHRRELDEYWCVECLNDAAHDADKYRRLAKWAERKADEAAASSEPWWLGNLRVYQNMASKFWSLYYKEMRNARSS